MATDQRNELGSAEKALRAKVRQAEKLAGGSDPAAAYVLHAKGVAARQSWISAAGRNIGPTPGIADVKRRKRAEKSLRVFCEIYNAAACYWPWCPDHRRIIAAIEESVFQGAMLAFAMPRGAGKSTLCRMAMLWAISYAHIGYGFLIGANEPKAIQGISALKGWMRCLTPWVDDFPEISHAVKALGKLANRANGQIQDDVPTDIVWEKTQIILPRVKTPPNMTWHKAEYAPTAGIVVGVSGLTGEGLRGSLVSHPDGRQVRPDFILLDDPQTDESARSPQQNADREELIAGAILGMASPDRPTGAVMPCTVIRPDDMVDRALDRKRNPLWRGVRTKMLVSMPKNLAAWEKYFEIYTECMGRDAPDFKPANRYYRKHRKILNEGAKAAWTHRKYWELSAIQHAMNIYCRNRRTFMAEYQNEPLDPSPSARHPLRLKPELLATKLNRVRRGIVSKECEHLTAYIDVGGDILHWMVCGWTRLLAGGPIDYGTFPEQPVRYATKENVLLPLARLFPGFVQDAYLLAAIEQLTATLIVRQFVREDERLMLIEKILVDIKWGDKNKLLRAWCRRHPHHGRILHAAQGYGFGATRIPMADFRPDGARSGEHWRNGPPKNGDIWVTIDTNWWKSLAASRLLMPLGTPGAWTIFGDDPKEHAMFFDHCCVEHPDEVTSKEMNRTVTEWKAPPGIVNNDLWDCLCGCAVGASMLGCVLPGLEGDDSKPRGSWFAKQKRRSV
jgi:hypothetical protein